MFGEKFCEMKPMATESSSLLHSSARVPSPSTASYCQNGNRRSNVGNGCSTGNEKAYEKSTYPTSSTLPFPYPTGPYPQQAALMDALLEGIPRMPEPQQSQEKDDASHQRTTRILALESPTGTGKSLSLACAGLAWLDHEEGLYYSDLPEAATASQGNPTPSKKTPSSPQVPRSSPTSVVSGSIQSTSSDTGMGWLDSWQPSDEQRDQEERLAARNRAQESHTRLVKALDKLRLELPPPESTTGNITQEKSWQRHRERRENLLRMALTKSRMEERKRARMRKRKRGALVAPRLAYEDDEDGNGSEECGKRNSRPSTPGSAAWLLDCSNSQKNSRPPQIIYAARTHSQLSQFVREIRKTKWGSSLRVVALASRGQGMCGALTHPKKPSSILSSESSEARLTEACLELRKPKGSGGGSGCSHYNSHESVSTLALHAMVEATDVEDLVALGRATKTCAYYATREALPHAQLVVLPYASLCSPSSREALGLELHCNTLVLVDEAHNLPSTISNLTSATLTKSMAVGARKQLENYLQKYVDRLSPHHLRLLGDLKKLVRGLLASMEFHSKPTPYQNPPTQAPAAHEQRQQQQQRQLLSSSQFLVSQRLETINLFPVLRYMKESKLSQKLLGFIPRELQIEEAPGSEHRENEASRIHSHISPMSVVEAFLRKLTYASDDDGKIAIDKGDECQQAGSNDGGGKEAQLRFCVLNPAVQARDDLWTAPRAVALVGGTLQPLDVMMRELIPGNIAEHAARAQSSWNLHRRRHHYNNKINTTSNDDSSPPMPNPMFGISNPYQRNRSTQRTIFTNTDGKSEMEIEGRGENTKHTKVYKSDDFWAFTCGHVVNSSQVLLQSLTKVGNVTIDVRHKTRATPQMTKAIGKALVNLCNSVKHGLVVFLPSYKYEALLIDAWKNPQQQHYGSIGDRRKSIWDQLQEATTVVREPKEASQVESTLALYSRAASKSPRGALLLSVVGGKLSEGINFADDLCRCVVVVGLPFADRSDPLLQEKLKLVAASTNGSSMPSAKASSDYYRSLCLRAVNQSVGRAIRHARDWATIILMDARYPSDEAVANGLPSWLTESTPSWRKDSGDLKDVMVRTNAFFDGRLS